MSDPFVGEIRIFAGNFPPTGWAQCNGQLLPISQNTALFSLLGTNFGGDGKSTFGLPDLRDRMPVGAGQGPGLSNYQVGDRSGEAKHTLTQAELPPHSHTVRTAVTSESGSPSNAYYPAPSNDGGALYHAPTHLAPMSGSAAAPAGNSWAHNNQQPALVTNFIIALQGIFPPRS
ncbi:MAG: phage tail protein [Burkholderiales bacterium]|nr:phage tail protein [Burkholderiales bacterium]